MNFKNWLSLIEDGGGVASGNGAGGVSSGATTVGTGGDSNSGGAPSSETVPSGSNSASNDSESGGTDSKDIAKVPNRCCGWGIWSNYPISKKRKKRKN